MHGCQAVGPVVVCSDMKQRDGGLVHDTRAEKEGGVRVYVGGAGEAGEVWGGGQPHILRMLHLGFHKGLRYELEGVACKLGVSIDFESFPDEGRCSNTKYNVDTDHARLIWERHGSRWLASYDVIITSDTAPIARVFLEHVHHHWTHKAGKRIIIWVCNRFDYHHIQDTPVGTASEATTQSHFPEPEFYALYARAANGSLGTQVSVLAYNAFETYYASFKGMHIHEPVLRPSGLKSTDACLPPGSSLPSREFGDWSTDDLSQVLFLPPRSNDKIMEGQCVYLGLACFRGSQPLVSVHSWSVQDWQHETHAPILYHDARELEHFKGVLHIPYAWSTLAFWEFLQVCFMCLVKSLYRVCQLIELLCIFLRSLSV